MVNPHLLVFLTAAILLAIAPGPGMLYVLARTLAGGRREGLLSALGNIFSAGWFMCLRQRRESQSSWRNPLWRLPQ